MLPLWSSVHSGAGWIDTGLLIMLISLYIKVCDTCASCFVLLLCFDQIVYNAVMTQETISGSVNDTFKHIV